MENLNICTYVERIKVSNDNKEFLKKIEEVCTKIHESKRVILVGALYPMSIAVEFQTDLISFGKTVLQYHTYDKDMIFNEMIMLFLLLLQEDLWKVLCIQEQIFHYKIQLLYLLLKIQPMQERNSQLIQFKYQEDLMALISIIK